MARGIHKLTALAVSKATEEGLYGDGGGLYLQIKKNGKSWLFRYMQDGKARAMGLGSENTISLAEARLKALECRKRLSEGIDPIDVREAREAARKAEQVKRLTFDECAAKYIEAHSAGWRNAKHVDQWRNTLATYASPTFGSLPVSAVDTALVVKALESIWTAKPETATRVRGRIESVLDWATVRGYRSGDLPGSLGISAPWSMVSQPNACNCRRRLFDFRVFAHRCVLGASSPMFIALPSCQITAY